MDDVDDDFDYSINKSTNDNEQATEDITLHTIVGEATPHSIQVRDTIKGIQLQILIDLGANLNFIHGRWV